MLVFIFHGLRLEVGDVACVVHSEALFEVCGQAGVVGFGGGDGFQDVDCVVGHSNLGWVG